MPLQISTEAIREKNRVRSQGVFLLLLEVVYDQAVDPARFVWNTEDVVWGGYTWHRAAFDLGEISETKESELPSVDLVVYDILRVLIPALADYAGAVGSGVWIRWINTEVTEPTALVEEYLEITDVDVSGAGRINFKLGADNIASHRSPADRFLKEYCRYGPRHGGFKGPFCGYQGDETWCDRSYARCDALGMARRFGGQLGVGQSGIYA